MSAGPSTLDIAEQLSKLAKLHADGAISDDEFASLKAKLLASDDQFKYRAEKPALAEDRKGETANIGRLDAELQDVAKSMSNKTAFSNPSVKMLAVAGAGIVAIVAIAIIIAASVSPAPPLDITLNVANKDGEYWLRFIYNRKTVISGGHMTFTDPEGISHWDVYVTKDQQDCRALFLVTLPFVASANPNCAPPFHVRLVTDRGTLDWNVNQESGDVPNRD